MTADARHREEQDSHGHRHRAVDAYWGAQTARAVANFPAGSDRFPPLLIHALGRIKRAATRANAELGVLDAEVAELIEVACGDLVAGRLDDEVVVPVWQSGSGTQLNMNVNEVIAGRCQRAGRPRPRRPRARAPQRPRQPLAIQQRRHPHRPAPGRPAGDATSCCRRCDGAASRRWPSASRACSATSSRPAAPTSWTPCRSPWARSWSVG